MKILRVAGAVLTALLIAYLFECSSSQKPLNKNEISDAPVEQTAIAIRQQIRTGD